MKLQRLTERIWYYPYEEERDRPNLCYIKGDKWSLAVDAGHSDSHVDEFYRELVAAGLPLPALTALTHWHWDHTLGMHAAHGLCVSNRRTCGHLRDFQEKIARGGREEFLGWHESIRKEYAGGKPVIVTLPDLVYEDELRLEAGNCPVRLFRSDSPHTDDCTLVHVPGEKVLILGDATGGTFPSWEKDPALCRRLAETIRSVDADIFLDGHWTPVDRAEALRDLLEDA